MRRMLSIPLIAILAAVLLVSPVASAQTYNDSPRRSYSGPSASSAQAANDHNITYVSSKKPWYKSRTMKNVGIGAVGGAAFGGLTGGRKGAAIGGLLGGGGGYVYNRVTKPRK
jgi:outer membrane lipoprotein SlyB